MTSSHSTERSRTPWPVHLVRLLVAVEVALACVGLLFLGFLIVLGLSWSVADGDVSVLAVLGAFALPALLIAFVVLSITAARRLGRNDERARTVLARLQWALLAGLVATPITDDWLGFGLANTPLPMFVLLGCGTGTLAALQRLRTPR